MSAITIANTGLSLYKKGSTRIQCKTLNEDSMLYLRKKRYHNSCQLQSTACLADDTLKTLTEVTMQSLKQYKQ